MFPSTGMITLETKPPACDAVSACALCQMQAGGADVTGPADVFAVMNDHVKTILAASAAILSRSATAAA